MRTPLAMALFLTAPPLLPAADDAALVRALAILEAAPVVDGHNDVPWAIRTAKTRPMDVDAYDLSQTTPGQTDLARLRKGRVGGQFWSVFIPGEGKAQGYARVQLEQIELTRRMIDRYPQDLALALTADDVTRAFEAKRIASLLGIEGGHAIENSLDVLRQFHELGVRYMTLTHSSTIDWADAATDSAHHGGLTRFGEEVVREMNRLGMLVDLSHVSPETMEDAIRVSQAPVIFSHSSARALADHPRNVPDGVLRMLTDNGGIVMINFYSGFVEPRGAQQMRSMFDVQRRLREQHPNDPEAARRAYAQWRRDNPVPRGTVGTLADHIDHVRRVAGIDHVGLGSDYDGVTSLPEGMDDVSRFPYLTAELLRRGYSDEDVAKVLGGNILRIMRQAEQTATRLQGERGPSQGVMDVMDGRLVRP
jgi:membrane dipeptidase